jgi:hypothetical protein
MARANQGVRQDLNFSDIENEVVAISNLAEVGLPGDLKIIQNNLRNKSFLALNSVDLTTNEFIFNTDKTLTVTAGRAEIIQNDIFSQTSRVTVEVSPPYNTYRGSVITVTGFTGTASTIFNGSYQTIDVGTGGTSISYRRDNCLSNDVGTIGGSAQALLESGTNFVYTNDDIVNVSTTVSVGSTTLSTGTDYFICNSDFKSRFKLSFTSSTSTSGINTVDITAVPAQFDFIRKEPVYKENIENFIKPEIQDDEEFGGYLASTINSVMESTQAAGENAEYFITKKYKGTEDTNVDTDIKFEGTVNLFDPVEFNANTSDLLNSKSPGIFIGNTRAFSADNNPWTPATPDLSTDSFEVTIGELEFKNGIEIEGISQVSATTIEATSFTHKIPVTINGETYYLLMKPS